MRNEMKQFDAARCCPRRAKRRGAFTIVELLTVVAVIVFLLSILIVALNTAMKSSQSANTRALMNSIKSGLVQFENDVGYLPPVLQAEDNVASSPDEARGLLYPPDPRDLAGACDSYAEAIQDWYSETALADYLIGYGEGADDGYGYTQLADPDEGILGIRHPGSDGVWNATQDNPVGFCAFASFLDRNPPLPPSNGEGIQSRRLGPYIDLKDERLLASTNGTRDDNDNLRVFFPGEAGYDPDDPKVIVDYWGNAIRYYRRVYPPGRLGSEYRVLDALQDHKPTLADVIVLRTFNVPEGQAIDLPGAYADANGDTTATRQLKTARFALFSPGPDKSANSEVRYDADELNRDNIVEVGQ